MERPRISENDRFIQHNVRVSDRFGIRICGNGILFDLRSELKKSETMGGSTFAAIYYKPTEGGEIIRINPDKTTDHFIRLNGENNTNPLWVRSKLSGKDVKEFYPHGVIRSNSDLHQNTGEVVIVPNGVYQNPELLSLLPESNIADEFTQIESSLT